MASTRPPHSNRYPKPRSHRRIWLTLALLFLALSCMGMVATSVTERHGTAKSGDPVSLNSTTVNASVPVEPAPAGNQFFSSESATMALFGTALLSVAALMHRRRA